MKRVWVIGLILMLSLSILGGCDKSDEMTYEDGNYSAESDIDENGWKGLINITVENKEITIVDYDEIDENDNKKTEDEEYSETMDNASGIRPEDAFEELEEALINTQNAEQIDAVTGATSSSEQFKKLAEKALNK